MTDARQGGSAFPTHPILYSSADQHHAQGMSLRDWFAGQALVGALANSENIIAGAEPTLSVLSGDHRASFAMFLAAQCYDLADAMIAAREAGGASVELNAAKEAGLITAGET